MDENEALAALQVEMKALRDARYLIVKPEGLSGGWLVITGNEQSHHVERAMSEEHATGLGRYRLLEEAVSSTGLPPRVNQWVEALGDRREQGGGGPNFGHGIDRLAELTDEQAQQRYLLYLRWANERIAA